MKSINRICLPVVCGLALAAIVAIPAALRADGTNAVATTKPVPYPLTTCVVSGDKLGGDMGPAIEFIYQNETNGINQEIKFCCPMCEPTFLGDPDKYMKIIKAAEAKAKAKN
jgi:hypothetical protein